MKQALLLLICATGMAFGQTGAGTLTGVVTDATGAAIANVAIVATSADRGTKLTGATSSTGNYTIPQMPVGRYQVEVAQTGFKTIKRENVLIAAAQTLRLDLTLEVGATSEAITITAETTLLQKDTGALVRNISPDQIQNLPVLPVGTFIRDSYALAVTLPGAVSGGSGFAPRMNGLPAGSNQYRV
ncbi:MAG: carboxypeptidase-like regulatory domain-containing protein, partial [Acidobacteriota bacterium]